MPTARTFSLASVIVATAFAAACAENRAAAPDPTVLRIGVGLTGTARGVGLSVLTDLLYAEPLLAREWDGRIVGRTARKWGWEARGTALRIQLKDGIRFHDGTSLTAELVVQQLESRVATADRPASPGFQYVTRISSPDELTILLHVVQPDMLLLAALTDIKLTRPKSRDISTGPFRLVQKTPTVRAERFDQYHGGRSGTAAVEIVPFETQRSAWAALLRGQINAVQEIDREAVEFLAGNSQVRTYSSLQPFYVPLVFNVRHPILENVEVRRAIAEAIDTQEIIDRVLRGKGSPAAAPVWPLHWAYSEQPAPSTHDPRRARARLEAAGYPERPSASDHEPPSRFTIKCLVWGESTLYERLALVVQRQLFAVGVNLEIELLPLDAVGKRAQGGDFEAYILPTNASRTLERMYWLWRSKSPENPTPTQNSGYTGADELLDELRRSTQEDEIRTVIATLTRTFLEDAPAVFMAWLDVTRAVDARFSVGQSDGQDPFQALWQWRLVGGEVE